MKLLGDQWESPPYLEATGIGHHQPGSDQGGEMSGQPHILPLLRSPDQPKQLGHGSGPDGGYPEPAHVGVGGLEATGSVDQHHGDQGPDRHRRAERSARVPRG
jgi:hypothetical protein